MPAKVPIDIELSTGHSADRSQWLEDITVHGCSKYGDDSNTFLAQAAWYEELQSASSANRLDGVKPEWMSRDFVMKFISEPDIHSPETKKDRRAGQAFEKYLKLHRQGA